MAHIPGDRPYTVTHKSRVASYILTHAHEHPECTPWRHRGKPHRLSPRELVLASKLQLRLAAACASRRSLDALIHGSLPHRARTQRSGRGWAALLGQRQDGTLSGGGTWDVAAGGPSSMRSTGWMMSMSCSATGAPPSLVQHQHLFAPSAGRSVPRRLLALFRPCTARAPSKALIRAPGTMTRGHESACRGLAVPC